MQHKRALLRALKAWQQALGHDSLTITNEAVRLAQRPQPCHGFANVCCCPECLERIRNQRKPRPAAQPWEQAA
jgi:hypothetical protein